MTIGDELRQFEQSRRDAAEWCATAGRNTRFRTPELRPSRPEIPTSSELGVALAELVKKRRELLPAYPSVQPGLGSVLICEFNSSTTSGESEAETDGFFDSWDRPPWDTWICNVPRPQETGEATVLSWVPSSHAELVSRGIEVNP